MAERSVRRLAVSSKLVMWADSGEGPEILNGAELVDAANQEALIEALGLSNLDFT